MPAEASLPTVVEIPTETIIDIAAQLYAVEELLVDFNDGQETPTSDRFGEIASQLLAASATGGEADFRGPVAVEACARAAELRAERYETRCDPSEQRRAAERIRAHRDGLARYMSDEELAHRGADGG